MKSKVLFKSAEYFQINPVSPCLCVSPFIFSVVSFFIESVQISFIRGYPCHPFFYAKLKSGISSVPCKLEAIKTISFFSKFASLGQLTNNSLPVFREKESVAKAKNSPFIQFFPLTLQFGETNLFLDGIASKVLCQTRIINFIGC